MIDTEQSSAAWSVVSASADGRVPRDAPIAAADVRLNGLLCIDMQLRGIEVAQDNRRSGPGKLADTYLADTYLDEAHRLLADQAVST